jgi:bifunctional oligoribonuclease and PAP phosphatase NrnA
MNRKNHPRFQKPIRQISKIINNSSKILLTAYHRYDGDAVGCELAMFWALKKINKNPLIFNLNMKKELSPFKFLNGFRYIETDLNKLKKQDIIISFDSGEFPGIDKIKSKTLASIIINIDHHKTSSFFGDINWVEPTRSATGELVYELIKYMKIPMDKNIAIPLFVSISTDTGRFTFPNTTKKSFTIAAELMTYNLDLEKIYTSLYCNKQKEELELLRETISKVNILENGKIGYAALSKDIFQKVGFFPQDFQEYIDIIKSLKGIEVALLLREEDDKTRVSIRTNGKVDATKIAEKFGGGGHKRAAGCTLTDNLDKSIQKLIEVAKNFVK